MLAASVAPGHHVIVVRYEPEAFKIGVVLAVAAALILAGAVGWSLKRSHRAPLTLRPHCQGANVRSLAS